MPVDRLVPVLAIPHGEFEQESSFAMMRRALAIPHGEFEQPAQGNGGRCLAIPHGEFELEAERWCPSSTTSRSLMGSSNM